jgi:hypothetical protein
LSSFGKAQGAESEEVGAGPAKKQNKKVAIGDIGFRYAHQVFRKPETASAWPDEAVLTMS